MTKTVIANNLFEPLTRGGAEKVAYNLAVGFEQLGDEVQVIASRPIGQLITETAPWPVTRVRSAYYQLGSWPKWARLAWHLFQMSGHRRAEALSKSLREAGVDLLVTNNLVGLDLALGARAQAKGLKWVHILHDIQLLHPSGLMNFGAEGVIDTNIARRYQSQVRSIFGSPDLVISPSLWLLELHQSLGFFEHNLVMTSLNPELPVEPVPHQFSETVNFSYLGQLEPHKGVLMLIEAFQNYKRLHPESKAILQIIGDGSALREMQQMVQSADILFYGYLSGRALEAVLARTDCLVVPSLCYENSPTVIIEAARRRLPVIASDLGGIKELVSDSSYRFVPKVQSLTEKLHWAEANIKVLRSPNLPAPLSPIDYARLITHNM